MSDYYDRQGNEITWDEWLGSFAHKKVRSTDVGMTTVSTVWLGLNHQWGDGPPLIFETMIFGGEHDSDCWRYSTEQEAIEGHEHAVSRLTMEES